MATGSGEPLVWALIWWIRRTAEIRGPRIHSPTLRAESGQTGCYEDEGQGNVDTNMNKILFASSGSEPDIQAHDQLILTQCPQTQTQTFRFTCPCFSPAGLSTQRETWPGRLNATSHLIPKHGRHSLINEPRGQAACRT